MSNFLGVKSLAGTPPPPICLVEAKRRAWMRRAPRACVLGIAASEFLATGNICVKRCDGSGVEETLVFFCELQSAQIKAK